MGCRLCRGCRLPAGLADATISGTTAMAAACAKRFELPVTKVSNVYFGLSETLSPGAMMCMEDASVSGVGSKRLPCFGSSFRFLAAALLVFLLCLGCEAVWGTLSFAVLLAVVFFALTVSALSSFFCVSLTRTVRISIFRGDFNI